MTIYDSFREDKMSKLNVAMQKSKYCMGRIKLTMFTLLLAIISPIM